MSSQEPPKKKSKQVENKQGTLLSWVKRCTSNPEPGVVEETIRIKEQPGNENDLEPPTTIAGRQEATKRQLSPPDQVFVNVSDSPYHPKLPRKRKDPKLPRNRKAPVRHEVGEQDTHHFPETPKDHYRRIYFNAIDTVTQCIATRFEQEDFKIYVNIQELLLKSFASEPCDTELAEVVKLYSEDLDSLKLKGQRLLLPQTAESMGFDTSEFDVNDLLTFFPW